jgi:hypothetical protein
MGSHHQSPLDEHQPPQTLGQLLDAVEELIRVVEALEAPMLADDPLNADTVFEIERLLLRARAHLGRLTSSPSAGSES